MTFDRVFIRKSLDLHILVKTIAVRMEVGRHFTSKRPESHGNSVDSAACELPRYCPFRTPIIQPRLENTRAPLKSCRVLFDDDQDTVLNSLDVNIPRNEEISAKNGITAFGKLISREGKIHNGLEKAKEMKENLMEYEPYGFNTRMRLKYPQTPIFKKILESPLTQFNRMFESKIDIFKNQIKRKLALVPVDCKSTPLPYRDCGYKFFMALAEHYKKLQATTQCRIFYRISIYMQPYDESTWQWVLKFQQELGCLKTAYYLCKTAVMFLKNQNFVLKYLKLADKLEKPIAEIKGVLGEVSLKFQQLTKVYIQLAKLQYKFGNVQAAYRICYYLLSENDGNSNVILEIAKILESGSYITEAITLIYQAIEKGCKAYSVYALYLKLLESVYYYGNEHIAYILNKAERSLPQQVLWKIMLDGSRYYLNTGQKQQYLHLIKKSLMVAPANAKLKPYIQIQKVRQFDFGTNLKNSLLAIQCNKQGFSKGKITYYNFSEWKHYLHYSLFYTFYNIEQARTKLQQVTRRWPYAGRLWAEIIWVMRVAKEDVLDKWKSIIVQVPKSGEVWCEGGRILAEKGDFESAMFCFESAIFLTPQYGDSFIEAMKIFMLKGKYKQLQQLKKKILNSEPFYGNVWCFLKDHPRASTIQIYRKAKYLIQQELYRSSNPFKNSLTAIRQYNYLFQHPELVNQVMKEKIICAYDQLDNTRC